MDWCLLSPFDLSRVLPVGGSLFSYAFLTRASRCKITHASGYCGAWPGLAVSVSGSPNKMIGSSPWALKAEYQSLATSSLRCLYPEFLLDYSQLPILPQSSLFTLKTK